MANTTEDKLRYLIRSKEDVRLAIERMQIPCPEDTPFLDYGPKIKQVDVDLSDSTVTSDDLMEGVIAYDSKEQRVVGTIPDIGPLNFEPSDEEYIIPYGRTDGGKVNKADITKLAEYEACLRIANSVDNLDDYSDTTATAEDIALGKTAYSNGELLEGLMKINTANVVLDFTKVTQKTNSNLLRLNPAVISVSGAHLETYAPAMFYNCTNMKSIENITLKNLTSIAELFHTCSSLTTLPEFDTTGIKDMRAMCNHCTSLINIPIYNTSSISRFRFLLHFWRLPKFI